MGDLAPPLAVLEWSPSNLGADFGGYSVWARRALAAAEDWHRLFWMPVPAGRDPSVVEEQHTAVILHRLGWANTTVSAAGRFDDGWDLAVLAHNAATGQTSRHEDADLAARTIPGDSRPWLVSDARPYLCQPLRARAEGSDRSRATDAEVHGRDLTTARVRVEIPPREYGIDAEFFAQTGEDQLRYLRAAAASGEQMVLHLPLGDRIAGVISGPRRFTHTDDLFMGATFDLVETGRPPKVPLAASDINVPCGVILDGTADHIRVADAASLDPGSSAFSVVVCFAPTTSGGSDAMLSKGNVPAAAGYLIGTTTNADEITFVAKGASATATLTATDAGWFDGDPRGHVFIGSSSGSSQRLVVDGTLADEDNVTHGSIDNAVALAVGALNGGASGFCAGKAIAAAVYTRQLSAAEEQAATTWLLGRHGARMPYGPVCYLDLRDARTWNGLGATVKDLSGNRNHGALVSTPPTQGLVWPLEELEWHG